MSARITSIDKGSILRKYKVSVNDELVSINGNEINDVIDYMFFSASSDIELEIKTRNEIKKIKFKKYESEPLGLNFETYLIDEQRSCKNKCAFCFIDQMPKGLRETLYFKDDDARLSFLMGNYITLTNLSEKDIQRIIKMKISPINISVHTTDPELRVKMMKNPNASKIMEILKRFALGNIEMNCQIVLCKNLNDGEYLLKSMRELYALYPAVKSVSIVPVGLTKFRENLFPLESFEKEDAIKVIDMVSRFTSEIRKKEGISLFYLSDEFYVLAGRDVPPEEEYDSYPQIENGVGLMRSLKEEFLYELETVKPSNKKRDVALVTGVLASGCLHELCNMLKDKFPNINIKVYPIINNFFGEKITVAGLVCATDIIDQLKDKNIEKNVLIPSSMLRAERDMFLDDITLKQLKKTLKRKITVTENDGKSLLYSIIGRKK